MQNSQVLRLLDITRVEHNTRQESLFKIFICVPQAIIAREQSKNQVINNYRRSYKSHNYNFIGRILVLRKLSICVW